MASIDYLANTPHTKTSIPHILHLTKGRDCFDKHDYVYGVLGLFSSNLQRMICPRYDVTVAQTYTDLMVSYLKQERDLSLLRDCQLEGRDETHILPSWVPDLSSKTWIKPFEWQNAAGRSKAAFELLGTKYLQVSGVQAATVQYTENMPQSDTLVRIKQLWQLVGLQGYYEKNNCRRKGNMALDIYCKTLAGGYLRDRHPDEDLPTLESWRTEVADPDYLHKLFTDNADESKLRFHDQWVSSLLKTRAFFRTSRGFIGLGPPGVKKGQLC